MKKQNYWLLLGIAPLVLGFGVVLADRDEHEDEREHEEHSGYFSRWFNSESMQVNSLGSERYLEECGSCHFPFQPGFLPEASWQLIMTGLDDHFGENAELTDEDQEYILNYLKINSADGSDRALSKKIVWSLRSSSVPMRITETSFFKHEHDEISPRMLQNKGEKTSFSNCDSCHTQALKGSFNEHEIKIPGYGRWDD
ncbi:MAG: diheme cytochrome c [Candidatus Thiodiazotropha sp. 6PLUC1]